MNVVSADFSERERCRDVGPLHPWVPMLAGLGLILQGYRGEIRSRRR